MNHDQLAQMLYYVPFPLYDHIDTAELHYGNRCMDVSLIVRVPALIMVLLCSTVCFTMFSLFTTSEWVSEWAWVMCVQLKTRSLQRECKDVSVVVCIVRLLIWILEIVPRLSSPQCFGGTHWNQWLCLSSLLHTTCRHVLCTTISISLKSSNLHTYIQQFMHRQMSIKSNFWMLLPIKLHKEITKCLFKDWILSGAVSPQFASYLIFSCFSMSGSSISFVRFSFFYFGTMVYINNTLKDKSFSMLHTVFC